MVLFVGDITTTGLQSLSSPYNQFWEFWNDKAWLGFMTYADIIRVGKEIDGVLIMKTVFTVSVVLVQVDTSFN